MKKFNRREFVSALSLSTGYVVFGNPLTGLLGRVSSDPFQLVKLGESGLETTLLGIGMGFRGVQRSSALARQDQDRALAVVQHAYDVGIRFFDTADSYGTHGLMAQVLETIPREKVTIGSKMWTREGGIPEPERPDANIVVDRFREELNTDYIDLVQLHCMVDADWPETEKRQMDILSDLKSKGIIKAHGVSVHTWEAMKAAVESPWVDVLHARINPYGIAMDKPEPEEVVSLIHQAHNSGKGVIGMKLLGAGDYAQDDEKIDNALRFVLGLGSVDMIVIGFEHYEQIDNYAGRVSEALDQIRSG
ncbi:MAG: aldo/keto reductase [Gemmatimonadota bacterium]|nr:MAG: aldo/keto reductase [Gemmatimonadota bacterium]